MMASKIILMNNASLGKSPGEILKDSNDTICANNNEDMFVTVWLGVLELSTGTLKAANAGHEYPAIRKRDGRFGMLRDQHSLMVGAMDGIEFMEYEMQLEPGDRIFVYTDGIPEAVDPQEEAFGTSRMLRALNEPAEDPQQIVSNVREAVRGFVGDAEQFDDLTMLCLEYKGKEETKETEDNGQS
jgi:sigma-B regulation protein RsbU (phosphoserine phosphatase)